MTDYEESETGQTEEYEEEMGEMMTENEVPSSHMPLEQLFSQLKAKDIDDRERREIVFLLRDMLQFNPLDRPSAADLLKHHWFCLVWCVSCTHITLYTD